MLGNLEKQVAFTEQDDTLSEADKQSRITQLKGRMAVVARSGAAAGGLHIIGTERVRIRAGSTTSSAAAPAAGRPRSSRFYLSPKTRCYVFCRRPRRPSWDRLKCPV